MRQTWNTLRAKASFLTLFWISVGSNVAVLLWLMTSTGQSFLHALMAG